MKKEELRIGNYFYYEATVHVVTEIYFLSVNSYWLKGGEEETYICPLSQSNPIPISEEWAIRFGMHKVKVSSKEHWYVLGSDDENDYYMPFFHYRPGDDYISLMDAEHEQIIAKYYFVHDFQNIYFVLNREELMDFNV